jgi:hypothetical protein
VVQSVVQRQKKPQQAKIKNYPSVNNKYPSQMAINCPSIIYYLNYNKLKLTTIRHFMILYRLARLVFWVSRRSRPRRGSFFLMLWLLCGCRCVVE